MITMHRNERRQLRTTIKSSDERPFVIRKARYEVYWYDGEQTEDEGVCDVDKNTMVIILNPQNIGLYVVRYTMLIADETVIRKVHIKVREE